MPWISVKDRIPNKNESIAFAYDGKEIRQDIFYDNEWMIQHPLDYWGPFTGNITHWIPYPNPPEEI